ncbi:MAG: hypothetical protein FWC61_03140 [Proteobacteria bacterium]|nr:hypothetical protein [Pseudomonadota bacterium]
MNKKNYELSATLLRLANRGARKSIEAARKAGIANPYCLNGKIIYQLPDGTVTEKYKYPKKSVRIKNVKLPA